MAAPFHLTDVVSLNLPVLAILQLPIVVTTSSPGTSLTAEEEATLMTNYRYTGATTNTHPYLSMMVNYAEPIKFPGFDISEGCPLSLVICQFYQQ